MIGEDAMSRRNAVSENLSRTVTSRKPVARSAGGVVAAHHRVATQAGIDVLRRGGNAVDAAIATGFAAGVAEPWMSGIGGIGVMLVREAASGRISVIDFGARAPQSLDPADFPITEGADSDLFGWPMVEGNRNVVGAKAIAVPAMVAGLALAHERFGSTSWADLVMPAAEIAEAGVEVDWYTSLIVTGALPDLQRDPGCAAHFLRGGYPIVQGPLAGAPAPRMPWPALAQTLRSIAEEGASTFYTGSVARALIADIAALGGYLSMEDLAQAKAHLREPKTLRYRDYEIAVSPELNGGPTMIEALAALQEAHTPKGWGARCGDVRRDGAGAETGLGTPPRRDGRPHAASLLDDEFRGRRCARQSRRLHPDAALALRFTRALAADRYPDEQRYQLVRSAPGCGERDRPREAGSVELLPGHRRRRRRRDRARRRGRAQDHTRHDEPPLLHDRSRHVAGRRHASSAHRRVGPRQARRRCRLAGGAPCGARCGARRGCGRQGGASQQLHHGERGAPARRV
jgi:hypothetical protein